MTFLKNSSAILIILASIVTLSVDASSKKTPPKPVSQPKPKHVIPSKPGAIKFVTPGPGEKYRPNGKR